MYIGVHVKYPLFLLDCNETWILSKVFFPKNTQISYFMKIRPVEAELFHANRWTRRYEANSRFSQFCERA